MRGTPASGFLQVGHKLEKWQWRIICWHNVMVKCFEVLVFLLSGFVIGPSFMSISLLVLQVKQFFLRNWPEIWKSEIHPSDFCPIFGEWSELGIPNLTGMFYNEKLLNPAKCQVYSYRFWVITRKPTWGKNIPTTHHSSWVEMNWENTQLSMQIWTNYRSCSPVTK